MKKKFLLTLVLVLLCNIGAYAQMNGSIGVGGSFTTNYWNVKWNQDGKEILGNNLNIVDMRLQGPGFFTYMDFQYALFSMGLNFGGMYFINDDLQEVVNESAGGTLETLLRYISLSLYAKYPFSVEKLSFFPMAGFDWKIPTLYSERINGKTYTYDSGLWEEFSSFWLKLGLGTDISLSSNNYLRLMFLYGIGTNTKFYKDIIDFIEPSLHSGTINHGFDIKLAFGVYID